MGKKHSNYSGNSVHEGGRFARRKKTETSVAKGQKICGSCGTAVEAGTSEPVLCENCARNQQGSETNVSEVLGNLTCSLCGKDWKDHKENELVFHKKELE